MNLQSKAFGPLERKGDCLIGKVRWLPDLEIAIDLEADFHDPTDEELEELVKSSEELFLKLNSKYEGELRQQSATEVIDSVYCQSSDPIPADAVANLAKEMSLRSIGFLPGGAQFVWNAPVSFPDCSITAQIDSDLELDEVMVQEP